MQRYALQHEAATPTAARRVSCKRPTGLANPMAAVGIAPSAYPAGVGPGHVAVGSARTVGSDSAPPATGMPSGETCRQASLHRTHHRLMACKSYANGTAVGLASPSLAQFWPATTTTWPKRPAKNLCRRHYRRVRPCHLVILAGLTQRHCRRHRSWHFF
jgi:hypothetical protein